MEVRNMRTVDLFAGCGGLSLGFEKQGFEIVAAFELWDAAIKCYKANFNHPVLKVDLADTQNAVEIIKKHNTFKDYRKTTTYHDHTQRLLQLERLGQLEHLQRLGQLEHLQITNYSYEAFSDIKGGILYLDPPYEGTTINGYRINSFDSVAFYDWAFCMAKKNIVLLSSYKISDSRFDVAYKFETARSSLQVGASSGDCEKLFMPSWQLEQYTNEQLTLF